MHKTSTYKKSQGEDQKTAQRKAQKKAFSLVELSVTLLIIGVLVGGIKAGNYLIKSSAISAARAVTLASQINTIPDMIAWYETSMDGSFVAGQNIDKNQLTTWYNREPSGFLTQNTMTMSASPNVVYKAISTNNLPAVIMTASGDVSIANFTNSDSSSSTVVVVFKPTADITATASILSDSGSTNNSTSSIGIKSTAVSLNTIDSAATSFVKDRKYILMVHFNGANSNVFVNSTTGLGTIDAGTTTLDGFNLGDRVAAAGIAAEISEVIVYGHPLTDVERKDVFGYLSKKYKIVVAGL